MIANTTATEKSVSVNKSLEDAFEGKEYAEFMWINNSGKKYWEVSPSICKVTLPSGQEQICNSSDEFDELIKPYME